MKDLPRFSFIPPFKHKVSSLPKIYLHIGCEKTGSTYLQECLNSSLSELFENNYTYPSELFGSSNHFLLAKEFAKPEYVTYLPSSQNQFRDNLSNFLKKNKKRNIIFSAEHISSRLTNKIEILNLLDFLRSEGHKIVVLCYVRKPEDWILSKYQEYIKSGGKCSLEYYVKSENFPEAHVSYSKNQAEIIKNWNTVKNIIELHFIKYEDACKQELLEDFKKRLDLPKGTKLIKVKTKNISLSENQIKIIKCINSIHNGRNIVSKAFQYIFKKLSHPKSRKRKRKDFDFIKQYGNKQKKQIKDEIGIIF